MEDGCSWSLNIIDPTWGLGWYGAEERIREVSRVSTPSAMVDLAPYSGGPQSFAVLSVIP